MIVWCDHASDRSEVFGLHAQVECNLVQANDVTWPAVAWVCKSMKLDICTGFEHVETKTEEVVFSRRS